MSGTLMEWLESSREKLKNGTLTQEDLDGLAAIANRPKVKVLYLHSKSTNMLSPVAAWAEYDPARADETQLPSDTPPYRRVIDALADGWRIVQFPIPQLHPFSQIDNHYLGYEFILEKEL